MTKQLIITNEFIGMKCWFWSDGGSKPETLGVLRKVSGPRVPRFHGDLPNGGRVHSQHCRLALGDKTPYEGKGQPVPDGVMVRVWLKSSSLEERDNIATEAEGIDWDFVLHYQVQEQKLEPVCEHGVLESNLCSDCYEDAEIEDIEQSNTVEQCECYKNGFADICDKCRALEQSSTVEEHDAGVIGPIAKLIHYPECWDTMAYPTIEDAISEMAHCTTCESLLANDKESN